MQGYRAGDRVKVKVPSHAQFHDCTGKVVRTEVNGLAVKYEVSFDNPQTARASAGKFFEFQLERIDS
jgi:hypothetical protein